MNTIRQKALCKLAAGEFYGAVPVPGAKEVGTGSIPVIRPGSEYGEGPFPYAESLGASAYGFNNATSYNRLLEKLPYFQKALATRKIDPRYWNAHKKAVSMATTDPKIGRLFMLSPNGDLDGINRPVTQRMTDAYHRYMHSMTSTPVRVEHVQKVTR